jgi:hypothetical protein
MWGVIDLGKGDVVWVNRVYVCENAAQVEVLFEDLKENGHAACRLEPGDFWVASAIAATA